MDNKGNGIFLSVIGIATLLVAIVGATFAWFSVQTSGEVNAQTQVNTANLGSVVFANGTTATASGENVYPGWEANDVSFTITAQNTTEELDYVITATPTVGTDSAAFAAALTYNMSCVTTASGTCASEVTTAPTAQTTYTGKLATGNDVHTYTVSMSFPETNTNQNEYQEKSYAVSFSVALNSSGTKYTQSGSTRTIWSE